MLSAVYDCNIFWRALFSPSGTGDRCKKLIDVKVVRHFISPPIIQEITDILTRPVTLEKYPTLTESDIHEFIEDIVSRSYVIRRVMPAFDFARDPTDMPYLDLAIAARVDYLVTSDRDLLDLMTDTDVESKQFRQRFRHLKIVKPDEFLRIVLDRELSLKP